MQHSPEYPQHDERANAMYGSWANAAPPLPSQTCLGAPNPSGDERMQLAQDEDGPSLGIIQPPMGRAYMSTDPYGQTYHNHWNSNNEEFAQIQAKKWGIVRPDDINVFVADLGRTSPAVAPQLMVLAPYCDTFQEWKDVVEWTKARPYELNFQQYVGIKRLIMAFKLAGIKLTPLVSVSRSVAHYQVMPSQADVFRTIMYLYGVEPDATSALLPMLCLYVEVQEHSPGKVEIILTDLNPSDTTMQSFRKLYEYFLRRQPYVK